ncbi:MAG: ABC transporter ATP-binding protein [Opitutaceae bacterium]|nr:ABC transporter ATP-binding protein [Opitutaceae bacterium]
MPLADSNPASPSPAIRLREVAKRFSSSGPDILAPLNLDIAPGEFVSVLGPSGCGKSTLLRLMSGLDAPSAGELRLGGRAPAQCDDLAYVFQDATLLPWLKVGPNVETLLRLRRMPAGERARRRDAALTLVRLADRADAYPRQLSGGQRMRVSLARALALEPRVLLLDEPFGALDEMTRDHLGEELLAIHERQRWTAVFVTHSVAEAVFLSSRILVLAARPGRIAHDFRVELPHPRTHQLRRDPAYLSLVAEVSDRLRSVEPVETAA